MALPGHRRTSSHKRRRASHFALKKIKLTKCGKCGADVLPHHACKACGFYAGRQVLHIKTALDKKQKTARSAKKEEKKKDKKVENKKA